MKNSILWIIDGWRYWDKTNGNSYHLTRVTHTITGKSAMFDESIGNLRSDIGHIMPSTGNYYERIHTAPVADITYREWQRMLRMDYYAPVAVYEHGKKGCVNITCKILTGLRRKS